MTEKWGTERYWKDWFIYLSPQNWTKQAYVTPTDRLNWIFNTFTSRDSMTSLCIDFSVSPCLHLLCLSFLLYSNLSLLFPLPSITDTVNRLFLATETCAFENGSSHLPSESEELWILQLPLTGHTFPTALIGLANPICPAAPCSASNMWCSELGTPFQLRPCKCIPKRKGCFPCPTGSTPIYTLEHDICFFLNSLGLSTHVQLLILKNTRSFPKLARFPPPHNLSCEAGYSYLTAQTYYPSSWAVS